VVQQQKLAELNIENIIKTKHNTTKFVPKQWGDHYLDIWHMSTLVGIDRDPWV
jgi:hypothetical protein